MGKEKEQSQLVVSIRIWEWDYSNLGLNLYLLYFGLVYEYILLQDCVVVMIKESRAFMTENHFYSLCSTQGYIL